MANAQQQGNARLDIELSEETAEGIYSNLVMIAHSPEEFIFDFIRVMPGVPKAKVRSRIIVTPAHARRLLRALEENIARYEDAYGDIEDRGVPPEDLHYSGIGGEA